MSYITSFSSFITKKEDIPSKPKEETPKINLLTQNLNNIQIIEDYIVTAEKPSEETEEDWVEIPSISIQFLKKYPSLFESFNFTHFNTEISTWNFEVEDLSSYLLNNLQFNEFLTLIDTKVAKGELSSTTKKIIQDLIMFNIKSFYICQKSYLGKSSYSFYEIPHLSIPRLCAILKDVTQDPCCLEQMVGKGYETLPLEKQLAWLSLLSIEEDSFRKKVISNKNFHKLLKHSNLKEILAASSSHLPQSGLDTCVGASLNRRFLDKLPNIIAMLHFAHDIATSIDTLVKNDSRNELNVIAFQGMPTTKKEYALLQVRESKKILESTEKKLEKLLECEKVELEEWQSLTRSWNQAMDKLESVIEPTSPRWIRPCAIEGSWHTSNALTVVGSYFNFSQTTPKYEEVMKKRGVSYHCFNTVTFPFTVEHIPEELKSIQYSLSGLNPKEQMNLIDKLWSELFMIGGSTCSKAMSGGDRHEHYFKAILYQRKEMFCLNDPMSSSSMILSKEEFLEFILSSPRFQIERESGFYQ